MVKKQKNHLVEGDFLSFVSEKELSEKRGFSSNSNIACRYGKPFQPKVDHRQRLGQKPSAQG